MQIAIITPSSPCNPEVFNQGLEILRSWGHDVLLSPLSDRPAYRYLAGTAGERLEEIEWALNSPAELIMAGRGGFGAHHLLPTLAARLKKSAPKGLLGFSDITALHQLWLKAGFPAYHGPNVTTLAKLDETSAAATRAFLQKRPVDIDLHGHHGRLIGGNMAMLASLCGTPYLYHPREPLLLFLEDIGERPYRLDRLLQQLLLSGYFRQVEAVFLGEFKDCEAATPADYSALDVVEEFFQALNIPCYKDFPTGHGTLNKPITLGKIY